MKHTRAHTHIHTQTLTLVHTNAHKSPYYDDLILLLRFTTAHELLSMPSGAEIHLATSWIMANQEHTLATAGKQLVNAYDIV